MGKDKLLPCPFCGIVPRIVVCDDEGDIHEEDGYEEHPWSGLTYGIDHSFIGAEDRGAVCPISNEIGDIVGGILYENKQDLIESWNDRAEIEEEYDKIFLN